MNEYIIIKQANKHLKTHFHLHPLAPAVTTALSQALFFSRLSSIQFLPGSSTCLKGSSNSVWCKCNACSLPCVSQWLEQSLNSSFTDQQPGLHPDTSFSFSPHFKIFPEPFQSHLLQIPQLYSLPFVSVSYHSILSVFQIKGLKSIHSPRCGQRFSKFKCDYITLLLTTFQWLSSGQEL